MVKKGRLYIVSGYDLGPFIELWPEESDEYFKSWRERIEKLYPVGSYMYKNNRYPSPRNSNEETSLCLVFRDPTKDELSMHKMLYPGIELVNEGID